MSKPLSAVVVAAGKSQRMGFDKLMTPLARKPLLLHTLEQLLTSPLVGEVVLVIREGVEEQVRHAIGPVLESGKIQLTVGGAERQDSVRKGLKVVAETYPYVMIHDAARPFVTAELIEKVFQAAEKEGAAVCGMPASDSLKEVGDNGYVSQTVDRAKVWQVQTPQIFRRKVLEEAYEAVFEQGKVITDDTAAVEALGHPVQVVSYGGVNFKITTPEDWKLAAIFLNMSKADSPVGKELRGLMHDMNNYLTPLLGYAFLIGKDLAVDSKEKRFAEAIVSAGEKCQSVTQKIHQLVHEIFLKNKTTLQKEKISEKTQKVL